MGYRLIDLECSEPFQPIRLAPDQSGFALVARWHGRPIGFCMEERPAGALVVPAELKEIADREFAAGLLEARLQSLLAAPSNRPAPSLTIAICTRDRAERLGRLLGSIERLLPEPVFPSVELMVIDNGSTDHTREVVTRHPAARHVVESRPGLNFARNRALAEARGDLIAYLDDDVVVDPGWLRGLAAAWRSRPDAGGFSGLVLPYRLDTEAQLRFERRGGFRRGFRRIEFRSAHHHNPLFPVGAGSVGAGCNMAFDRRLLLELGGFDEALDTGAPLPGGGDLDIFYRAARAGRVLVYEPRMLVFHRHRRELAALRGQYRSWGEGFMAFVGKSLAADPAERAKLLRLIAWWLGYELGLLRGSLRGRDGMTPRLALAELAGGVRGLAGGYGRSRRRVEAIRRAHG